MSAQLIHRNKRLSLKPTFNPLAMALSAALFAVVPLLDTLPLLPSTALAQTQYQSEADAPARVGRLAYASGGVQFFSEAEPQWRAAQLNEPLTSRNSLLTDGNARAEVRVGPAAFSLDSNSQIDISQLDDQVFSSNLVRGTLSVRVSQMDNDDLIRVNTPNGEFELERAGRYRIDADDNASRVTVFSGRAQAIGSNGAIQVDAGKSLRVSNQGGGESFMFGPADSTGFDSWTLARDERYSEGPSVKYVSRNMTGYEDLDANGRWANDSDYGPVWYPTTYVTAGWAPYRYGRWAWVAPWGWTWVDDAPWGFAPFHYGRWVSIGGTWGWTPGAYVARPVFAPALVGFYGGSNFSISFSVGGPAAALGWYPLAPWERYAPSYTRNTTYINRVNNITIINPPSRYAGQADFNRVRGGTVIRQSDFGNRREVSRFAARNVPEEIIRRAPLASPGTVLPQRPMPSSASPRSGSLRTAQSNGPEFNQQPGPSQFSRDRRPDYEQERERQRERMGDGRDDRGNSRQEWARPNGDRPAAIAPQAPQQLPDPRQQSSTPSRFNRDSERENQRLEQRAQQEREQAQQQQQQLQRQEQQRQEQGRQQQEQQRQQREFERRQAPVRMEALPNQQAAPQQWQRTEPQRVEQRRERVEAPRQERPAALNVPPPPPPPVQAQPQPQPQPAPSRFNQQPQEQKNDNPGNRENNGRGSRFRPPDQQ